MAYTKKDYDEMQAVWNNAQSKKDTIDPARRAQAEKLYNDFMTEWNNQNGSITNMYANDDNTVTTEYANGTSKVTDRQGNEITKWSITNMYGNDDGTVTTEYDNGTKQITDQQGNPIMKSNQDIAKEVRQGKRGNGQDRRNRLTEAGYDYNTIQQQVNRTAPKRPIPPVTPNPEPESTKPTLWFGNDKELQKETENAINEWVSTMNRVYGLDYKYDPTTGIRDWKGWYIVTLWDGNPTTFLEALRQEMNRLGWK